MPSRLGLLLDITARNLERVIYYENYLVIDPGKTPLEERQLLTDQEYLQAQDEYGEDAFVASMGAEAVRDALARVDLESTVAELHEQIHQRLVGPLTAIAIARGLDRREDRRVLEQKPAVPEELSLGERARDEGLELGR